MKKHLSILTGLVAITLASPHAQGNTTITFTWTGTGSTSCFFDPNNWAGDVAPASDGTKDILFGDVWKTFVIYAEIDVNQLAFVGNNRPYTLMGQATTTYLGAGGINYDPAQPVRSYLEGAVGLRADQTWDILKGALVTGGDIAGDYTLTKTGAGTLVLDSVCSTWTGGLVLTQGGVVVRANMNEGSVLSSNALGTGSLTFSANGGTLIAEYDYYYTDNSQVLLGNHIVSNGLISTKNRVPLHFTTGGVELNADTTISTRGEPLFIDSAVTETGGARKLTIDSETAVIVSGSSGWTGGTEVVKGALIFGGTNNTPATSGAIKIGSLGYVGIGVSNDVSGFLGKIDKVNSTGTIGFDSAVATSLDHFTSPIDLTGFNASIRLGSATAALLETGAIITPQGTDYRFGGGGGSLVVASKLTGARNLVLDTPVGYSPLTVRLLNTTNDFSGTVSVQNSALIFGTGVPLPIGSFSMDSRGYIGTENATATFLARFATNTQGIIGFDLDPSASTTRVIADDINLSAFTNGVYLGSASAIRDQFGEISGPGVQFTGTLYPGADGNFRFAGYKGGAVEIASTLGGTASVYIGDLNSLGTLGDAQKEEYSTVLLSGDNSYTGTTTLYAGRLALGHVKALGTGALVVQPHNIVVPNEEDDEVVAPALTNFGSILTIANAIQLNADLNIESENSGSALTLIGQITGTGELRIEDYSALTLGNDGNTFSGGIELGSDSILITTADHATGTGPLSFGDGYNSHVNLASSAPVIGGLFSRDDSARTSIHLALNNTVLTVAQPAGVSQFIGDIHTDFSSGAARFVKDGPGTLRFYGDLAFGGTYDEGRNAYISAEVRAGTLLFGTKDLNGSELPLPDLGGGNVLLSGGTLALDFGTTLSNAIIAESGRLAGYGAFNSSVTVDSGVTIAPGFDGGSPIGNLTFTELNLAPGGTLEWNLIAQGSDYASDLVSVSGAATLHISATEEVPFSLRIISLAANGQTGVTGGFVPGNTYHWMLLTTLSVDGTQGFDSSKFTLDVNGFQTNLGTGLSAGTFALSMVSTQLMLNFTAVPEPSTYALMALGLGVIGWSVWRRRR